jgi:hypothetical protein
MEDCQRNAGCDACVDRIPTILENICSNGSRLIMAGRNDVQRTGHGSPSPKSVDHSLFQQNQDIQIFLGRHDLLQHDDPARFSARKICRGRAGAYSHVSWIALLKRLLVDSLLNQAASIYLLVRKWRSHCQA